MNERIRELAEQAVEETQLMMIMEYKNFESKLYEKFAELIVKECMAVAVKQRKRANLNYNPGERFAEDLRQHFGVEE